MISEINTSVAKDACESSAIDISDAFWGSIFVPVVEATTTICFKCSKSIGGTYEGVKDEYGTLVSIPVTVATAAPYTIPDSVMKHKFIKIWTATAAGVDVAQSTAARNFTVIVKG